ncbi:cell division control protein 45 homolog [Neodiprion lecontei]|uniref:Cell division control protein 45 homolog n=1 Tax=Neodiprion lecontei TaxID=441921 RepID=A0A6J0BHR9_NEOLC|nr:cell division control protein 45 homolog [Neodiprion lecontei]
MFLDNIQTEFYNEILGNRCLLLVNFDIDAICACKILQYLLKNDNIVYTLVPVRGIQDLVQAYEENCEEVKYVILVNCGGTLDIVELLQPDESVVFYILDSHRPYDLCNVYSESQVRILGQPDNEEKIPEYTEVFRDNSSDEEEEDTDEDDSSVAAESRLSKRRRLNEEEIEKRRNRRLWDASRTQIMFNYTQYSYYGRSSAVIIYELAWKLSRDTLDVAWWGIIGATEQAILGKVESRVSVLETGNLQSHVSRLSHRVTDSEKQHATAVKLTYDKDLQLALYRHWTVEASLKHSVPTAVSLRLWSLRGENRLRELLAEMGLPLAQSKQRFSAMDLSLRHEFKQMIEKLASKYNVDSIVGASFTLQYGYRFKYCASDVVYSMLALLESTTKERLPQHCFLDALDCLSRKKKDVVERGIEKAKLMLSNIYKTAQGILEMKQVKNAGPFLYIVIQDGTLDTRLFAHEHALIMLAQFTLKAYVETSRYRNATKWPLIATAPFSEEDGTCLVVGIPPLCEDQPRSLFGRAFEQAAKNTNSYIEADYFDTTIIRLKIQERPKFFDALTALLII